MTRFALGNRNASKKLTDEQVLDVLDKRRQGRSYASIARDYDVTALTISRICNGESRVGVTKGQLESALAQFSSPPPTDEEVAESQARLLESLTEDEKPRADPYAQFTRKRDSGKLEIDTQQDLSKPQNEETTK